MARKLAKTRGPKAAASLSREFALDGSVLGISSSANIAVSLATDTDVLDAILKDLPFPPRPNGQLALGSIALEADAGKDVVFNAGQGTVSFHASAGLKTGMGVFDKADDALASLELDEVPGLDLTMDGSPGARYLVMQWGYDAEGAFSGSHPIGAVGTITFGAEGSRAAVYAVMHRLDPNTGAHTAISDTVASWRLPRHVRRADDLRPGTWVIGEADGSLAFQVAAQLGYDFNLVREAHLLGMTRDLGARIDAGVSAAFGFNLSGRYLVVVGREDGSSTVRMRLFKQSKKGFQFGLNINVGVTTEADLPDNADAFVQAVFGVHGLQVVRDLQLIEKWTDPTQDLSDTVARLVNRTGLELLRKATGLDPVAEFEEARHRLLGILRKWDALPEKVAAATWGILGNLDRGAATALRRFLTVLVDPDPAKRSEAIGKALQDVTFGDTPEGQFLAAIAEKGLLALTDQLDEVQAIAAQTLGVLDGDVIQRLQTFINDKLNLEQVRQVITENDFNKLDEWLVRRLSDFLDERLDFEKLDEIKASIDLVLRKRDDLYDKARQALNKRYSFELAASYQKNTTRTALLDLDFDLSQASARALIENVLAHADMDTVLTQRVAGVTLNQATLSHEIQRRGSVEVHMPFFDSSTQHINVSLARVTAEEDAGRVLVYALDSTDTVTVTNRYKSQLSVMGSLRMRNGKLDATAAGGKSIAYQLLQVKENMKLMDFEQRVSPFVHEHLMHLFPGGGASLQTYYIDLDRTVENALANGTNEFGDVALSMQVSLPGSVLAAWFRPRTTDELRRDQMTLSRHLQVQLKRLLSAYYFQDIGRLQPNPSAAALLLWSAIPPSTSAEIRGGRVQFNTDRDVFWNHPDPDLRHAMVVDTHTAVNLSPMLANARQRLLETEDTKNAEFFEPSHAGIFQGMVLSDLGDRLLQSLLFTESQMITGAAKALVEIQDGLSHVEGSPTKAIARLAEFGAAFTATFNERLKSIYGDDSLRAMSSMLLTEASRALDPTFTFTPPNAALSILVLKEKRTFQLADFLAGKTPERDQVAVAQTLVRMA